MICDNGDRLGSQTATATYTLLIDAAICSRSAKRA
jgi:hypothetical protein